ASVAPAPLVEPVAVESKPAAETLLPAEGAMPSNPAASAQQLDDLVAREVKRRERQAAAAAAAKAKRQQRAAAANDDEDTTVSDDDTGGGTSGANAQALRRAYLCRTQHRC